MGRSRTEYFLATRRIRVPDIPKAARIFTWVCNLDVGKADPAVAGLGNRAAGVAAVAAAVGAGGCAALARRV